MIVFVDLAGTRRLGKIVKINTLTTWVKVMNGAQTFSVVKRHNIKHNVTQYVAWGEMIPDETFYTTIRHTFKTD